MSDWQPVQLNQNRRDVLPTLCLCHETGSGVLYSLELTSQAMERRPGQILERHDMVRESNRRPAACQADVLTTTLPCPRNPSQKNAGQPGFYTSLDKNPGQPGFYTDITRRANVGLCALTANILASVANRVANYGDR